MAMGCFSLPKPNWEINEISSEITKIISDLISRARKMPRHYPEISEPYHGELWK